jgi:hypothetical protein
LSAHAYQLPAWYGLTFMAIVCIGAFWKGGREEQVAAAGVMLSWLVTLVLHDPRWLGPQWGAFGADIALLAVITVVAVRSPHYWPLFAAAFQLLCVMIHVARLSDPGVRAWAYATGQVIFTQLYMWAIVVGIWNSWRGRRRQLETSGAAAVPGATLR